MNLTRPCIVRIPALDQVRPAAHVFRTPAGITWVEPGYLDPYGATARAVHGADGEVDDQASQVTVTLADGSQVLVLPATPENDDGEGSCMAALADYGDLVVELDWSQAEERARVQAQLELGPTV